MGQRVPRPHWEHINGYFKAYRPVMHLLAQIHGPVIAVCGAAVVCTCDADLTVRGIHHVDTMSRTVKPMIHDLLYGHIPRRNVFSGSTVVVTGGSESLGEGYPIQAVVRKVVVLRHIV